MDKSLDNSPPKDQGKFLSPEANKASLTDVGLTLLGFVFLGIVIGGIKAVQEASAEDWVLFVQEVWPYVLIAIAILGLWKWRLTLWLVIFASLLILVIAILKWAFLFVF